MPDDSTSSRMELKYELFLTVEASFETAELVAGQPLVPSPSAARFRYYLNRISHPSKPHEIAPSHTF